MIWNRRTPILPRRQVGAVIPKLMINVSVTLDGNGVKTLIAPRRDGRIPNERFVWPQRVPVPVGACVRSPSVSQMTGVHVEDVDPIGSPRRRRDSRARVSNCIDPDIPTSAPPRGRIPSLACRIVSGTRNVHIHKDV